MKKKSREVNLLLILTLIVLLVIYILLSKKPKESYVEINKNRIRVEVADSYEEQTTGLMYRDSLNRKTGMLFIFDSSDVLGFWMKNTLIPLDMIFIDKNLKIVGIQNAVPCNADPCRLYSSGKPSKYVLEINGGFAAKNNVKIGDTIKLNPIVI